MTHVTRVPSFSGVTLGLLVATLASCTYGSNKDYVDGDYAASCGGEIERGLIDTDEAMEVDPGESVGIFVEYQSGGAYFVYTTCDTDVSGYACYFDIVLRAAERTPIWGVSLDQLEVGDDVIVRDQSTVRLLAYTDYETDGILVQVDEGEALRIDALLDGECAQDYLRWVSEGVPQPGAPSNPFELEPTSP